MITLLTCTGDRPRLFRRLERWMARQSLRWTTWIVVDDGANGTQCTLGQRYIRLAPGLPPFASFARNLIAGLGEHDGLPDSEFVFIIEDDDWYGPNYLASLAVGLMTHELAGESHSRYYNVSESSYYRCGNSRHAALCATAFHASLIPRIISLIDEKNIALDRRIWAQLGCSKHLQPTGHCVGLKAQAGRAGLTWAHRSHHFCPDANGVILKRWLGADAEEVLKYAVHTRDSLASNA